MIILLGNSKISTPIDKGMILESSKVVRFNGASDPLVIEKYKELLTDRIDVAALNGYSYGDSKNLHERMTKEVLFTRPIMVDASYKGPVKVHPYFLNKFKVYGCISQDCFMQFFDIYNHLNPSSGLITAFYYKVYLNNEIKCLNFNFNKDFSHYFDNSAHKVCSHNPQLESKILDDILKR